MRTKIQFNAILCVEEVVFYFSLLNLHQAINFLDYVVNNNLSYIGSKLELDNLCKTLMLCYLVNNDQIRVDYFDLKFTFSIYKPLDN